MTNKNRFQRGAADLTDRFSPEAQAARDQLAEEAPTATTKRTTPAAPKPRAAKSLPWEAPDARADLKRPFILRLSDVDMRKLDWLVEQGCAKSKHSFLLKVAQAAIEDSVTKRLKNDADSND